MGLKYIKRQLDECVLEKHLGAPFRNMWMVDSFSRLAKGVVLKNKTAIEIIKGLLNEWFYCYGPPQKGIWADNGGEFVNHEMERFCKLSVHHPLLVSDH